MKIISPEMALENVKKVFTKDRKYVFLISIILGLLVHFLFLGSLISSQDGLMHILHYSAGGYEASLGRWGIDFFDSLRFNIAIPIIVTIISIILLGITNILLLELFNFKSKIFKFLTIFAFVTAPSLCMTLLYTYTADIYFWSMFLSVLSVYFFYKVKGKKGYILGIISFIIMLSTYQSYMGMTIGLILILNIKDLLEDKKVLEKFV